MIRKSWHKGAPFYEMSAPIDGIDRWRAWRTLAEAEAALAKATKSA